MGDKGNVLILMGAEYVMKLSSPILKRGGIRQEVWIIRVSWRGRRLGWRGVVLM